MGTEHTKAPEEEIAELRRDLSDACKALARSENALMQAAVLLGDAEDRNNKLTDAIKEAMGIAERSEFKAISLLKLREIMEQAGIK